MGVDAQLKIAFADNKRAQDFSYWLYQNNYTNKTLFQNTVQVSLSSHGDHTVVMEEAPRRGGNVITDNVKDDDD